MKKKKIHYITAAVFLILLPLLYPCQAYASAKEDVEQLVDMIPEDVWPEAPDINSKSAIVAERNTGVILYEKNCTEKSYPASTTKLMTALLTLENTSMDEVVTYSWNAVNSIGAGASHIGIRTGEQLTVRDSLCGLLIPSANEVANGLAEHIGGSIEGFVAKMNQRAEDMGLVNTHFQNANGLHEEGHYTCAYDLYRILDACVSIPAFVELDSITAYVKKADTLLNRDIPMGTTNQLIKKDSEYYNASVICGKTGYTAEAGRVLATYASKEGMELICVTMGASEENHFSDTNKLLNYAFTNFSMMQLSEDSTQGNGKSLSNFTPLNVERQPLSFRETQEQGQAILPATVSVEQLSRSYRTEEDGETYLEYNLNGYILGKLKIESIDEKEKNTAFLEKDSYLSQLTTIDGRLYAVNLWIIAAGVVVAVLFLGRWLWYGRQKKTQRGQVPRGRKNRADDRVKYSKSLKKNWKKPGDTR